MSKGCWANCQKVFWSRHSGLDVPLQSLHWARNVIGRIEKIATFAPDVLQTSTIVNSAATQNATADVCCVTVVLIWRTVAIGSSNRKVPDVGRFIGELNIFDIPHIVHAINAGHGYLGGRGPR